MSIAGRRAVFGKRLRQAHGLAYAAGLLARHGRIAAPNRSLVERLADLPVRDLPVERPVEIRWNAHHVPFIEAANDHDLAVALGCVHMHLRAGQIETMRMISAGRVSEIAGPVAVDIDLAIRSLGIRDVVPGIIAILPADTRAWAEAFMRGVNFHNSAAAPAPEIAALGITPTPWTLTDFFTVARLFSADLSWPVLRKLLALRDRTAPDEWRALWPRVVRGGAPAMPPAADDGPGRLFQTASRAGAGSNAAAIAADRTVRGAAIVSGDPHLSLGLPNPWVVCSVAVAGENGETGLNALGLMLPGCPFFALGRNRDIAWGGTSLHSASSDFVDLTGLPPEAFTTTTETIRIRGGGTRTVSLRRTSYGPVVSDAALFRSKTPIALAWAGHRPSDELSAMLGLLRARNATEFRETLKGFAVPGQTMVYAGPDGIGRQVAVHLPRRRAGIPADLVVSRAEADAAWETLVTGDALFGEWDPQTGFVGSANEYLVGPAPDHVPLGHFFAPDERITRIGAILAPDGEYGDAPIDAARMGELFRDNRQPTTLAVRDRLAGLLPHAIKPPHRDFVAQLRCWDADYGETSRGALAYELLLGETAFQLLGKDALAKLQTVWTTRAMVARQFEATDPQRLAAIVARALPIAARRFRRIGTWGAAHRHRLAHQLAALPIVGRRYRQPGFPGNGANDTLNKTAHPLMRGRHIIDFGATARYVFDLADPDANEIVLFGGQDGWLGSDTAADQVALWRRGAGMRVPLRPQTARAEFPHLTVLRPD